LIESTEAAGIWTIQSGNFLENEASAALHAAAGFRTVGTRERIGQHHGVLRDVTSSNADPSESETAGATWVRNQGPGKVGSRFDAEDGQWSGGVAGGPA
jgi:hypothetical protein